MPEKKFNNKRFIAIFDFMVNTPELKTPAEVLLYAVIYAYPNHRCYASIDTLMNKCHVSNRRTMVKYLQSLVDAGLIDKTKVNGRKVIYEVIREPVQYSQLEQQEHPTYDLNEFEGYMLF